jgi:hypothetical protein
MRTPAFVVFFVIALSIIFGVNYYIYVHGLKAFGANQTIRLVYTVSFIILASAYVFGRVLERLTNGIISRSLDWLGAYWLGAMVYFLLIVIAIDLFRLINHFLPLLPAALRQNMPQVNFITGVVATMIVSIVLIVGRWNATHPQIHKVEINIPKPAAANSLRIAFASDIHLGSLVGQRQLRQMVETINDLQPDVILFGGDILDEDLTPVIHRNLGGCLEQLKAPLGKFTVTGNHEYIGGVTNAVKYLEEHGIAVLRDTSVQLPNGVWIIGREDRDSRRFKGIQRRALSELVKNTGLTEPLIVIDHQPLNLDETVAAGVDLQLSGHTHHGQMWPFNYITSKMYRLSRGYEQIGRTHFIVSSGYGTWGPPIRLASCSEIYLITVYFQPEV